MKNVKSDQTIATQVSGADSAVENTDVLAAVVVSTTADERVSDKEVVVPQPSPAKDPNQS